jgi:hypothetical protein
VNPEQLVFDLFAADTNGNGRRTVAELGMTRQFPAGGAERLLRELVRRGLADESLHAAAALVLVLDEGARPPAERRRARYVMEAA